MDNTFAVREGQPPENVLKNRQGLVFRQFTFCLDKLTEILAVHKFHNQKKLSLGFKKIGTRKNFRMTEIRFFWTLPKKSLRKWGFATKYLGRVFDEKSLGSL